MLAIATESIVKLVAFLAVGVFVTFVMFHGPFALVRARAASTPNTAAVLTRAPQFGGFCAMTLLSLFAIVLLPRQFHVAVVENHSEAEIRRAAWLFPALSRADQSVRDADRDGGPADVSGRPRRRRHVRAGAAARGPFRSDDADRVRRRPVGGDRHGDRRIGGARHHGVERHRDAAGAQAPRQRSAASRATPARGF